MNTTGKLESLCTELDERNDLNMEEKDSTKESLNSYLDFLERNYVGRQIQTGISVLRYPPELWSQLNNCIEGRALSTNSNEGFHSRLKHYLPQNNAIWALLGNLVNIEAETRTIRDEHRASLGNDDDEGGKVPGNGSTYRRWRITSKI
jgi:hypothetical protein